MAGADVSVELGGAEALYNVPDLIGRRARVTLGIDPITPEHLRIRRDQHIYWMERHLGKWGTIVGVDKGDVQLVLDGGAGLSIAIDYLCIELPAEAEGGNSTAAVEASPAE